MPTLAVGYSVKSHGIARDLDMGKHVIDIMDIKERMKLVEAFKALYDDEKVIKDKLNKKMLLYIRNAVGEKALGGVI